MKIIYENDDVLVVDKPAGIVTSDLYSDLKKVHRLDKDTSGVLLVAKNEKALNFLQKQFKDREVEKKYLALIVGKLKNNQGVIETLVGRTPKDRKKQKVYLPFAPGAEGKRKAITGYKVRERFKDFTGAHKALCTRYTLVEVSPKTGRKHQIRCHFSYLGHPIAGDKMYGFRNQPCPKGLNRQFLHASYLKIKLPDGKTKEFKSELPEDLKIILKNLEKQQ